MAFDIGRVLAEGFERATERNAAVLFALFLSVGLASTVAAQSVQATTFEQVATLLEAQGETGAAEQLRAGVGQLPLAVLPSAGAYALTVAAFVAGETVRVIADRTFVSDATGGLHEPGRNLLGATVNSILASVVLGVLLVVGTVLLVLPGLFFAVVFFFTRQEIAVEGENFVGALSGSVRLTKGHRFELFALAVVLFAVGVAATVVGSFVPGVGGVVAGTGLSAAVGVYVSAAAAAAYRQLRAERRDDGAETVGSDDSNDGWDDPPGVEM